MKKLVLFLLAVLIAFAAEADLLSKQLSLQGKLHRLMAPYGQKAGMAFIDLKSGWKFQIRGTEEFPAASVAKVPVMAAAYHLSDSGLLDLDHKVLFKESDKLEGSGVLRWMKAGKLYTLRNLIRLMIVLSDNTATKIVCDSIGLPVISNYLSNIGLAQTSILDPAMLKERPDPNINTTTPVDMARLLEMIKNSSGFSAGSSRQMLSFMKNQRYRWGIWRGVPPGTVVADKTGNLDGVLNDVGIVYSKKGNYILSIFTCGFEKKSEARKLINEISRITYEEYTGEKVISKRRLSRPPSGKSRRRSGRRGAVSYRK